MRIDRARCRAGVAGLAALLLAWTAGAEDTAAKPPNVLLVVLDTLRVDAVAAYGVDPAAHTPNLDWLAREGTLFLNARATSSWTLPTHASMFTGLLPFEHRAHHETHRLHPEQQTVAELLRASHETVGFSENPHIIRAKGFAQGFERYSETWRVKPPATGPTTERDFSAWLGARDTSRPFFAFVNLFTPHLPYAPPPEWQEKFFPKEQIESGLVAKMMAFGETQARLYMTGQLEVSPATFRFLRRLYLADVAYTDARLGVLLAALADRGLLDDTLVLVTSDHGEAIGEHGLVEHQFALYENVLHVPLVARLPGRFRGGATRADPVQLFDVAPTLLSLAGVSPERFAHMRGRNLVDEALEPRALLAEYMRPIEQRQLFQRVAPQFDFACFDRRLRSIQRGAAKLIVDESGPVELYNLATDPGENDNLLAERPDIAKRLYDELVAEVGRFLPRSEADTALPELDDEAREKLRSLGYIE